LQTTGITIWYHRRSDIPTSLSSTASSIDTSALGTPVASYSSSSCDISKFFASQQMTLDITMCGDYAGTTSVLEATCGALVGDQTCYSQYWYSFVTKCTRGLTPLCLSCLGTATYVLNSTVYNDAYVRRIPITFKSLKKVLTRSPSFRPIVPDQLSQRLRRRRLDR
jgi:hypothetical protein